MENNQGGKSANNGIKQEIRDVPETENKNTATFSAVKENEVSAVGSLDDPKENENALDEKRGGVITSVLICSEDCDKTEEIKGNETVSVNQESIDGDGKNVDERHNHEFLVGDLVWGKVKSHPWWPGLIYDPSDASDFAFKFKNKNKLLVAYFGDASCAWCSQSQLVPFVEHYEKMSKQSSSKSFLHAVEEALEELGRRVELKMICSCVPQRNLVDLARREAMNAGVRSGILMPLGAVDKLPSHWGEPAELLKYVKNLKQAGPVSNFLEHVLVKSWLSAFSRVKRGCCLPIYREPQLIEGLEDKSKDTVPDTNDFSVPIAVPIQGPSEEECGGSPRTLPIKGLIVTSTQKRKQKSVAELMRVDKGVKLKGKKKSKVTEETPSTTFENNKITSDDDLNENGIQQASTAGMIEGGKTVDNSVSHTSVVNDGLPNRAEHESSLSIKRKQDEDTGHDDTKASTAGRKRGKKKAHSSVSCSVMADDGVQLERVENESTQSIELKKSEDPVDDVDGDLDKKTLKRSISRERKNSKYLSAPYTIPSPKLWRSYSRSELETKSEKIATSAKVGERLTKVAGQLISSPRLTKCNNAVSEENMSGNSLKPGTYVVNPQTVGEKMTDNCSVDISASADQVFAEVLSAGVDIMSMDRSSIEPLKAFMSAFRSSMYLDTSKYELYQDQESGKKRKSSPHQPEDTGSDLNNSAVVSARPAAHSEKTDKPKSRVTKLKKAARAAAASKNKTSPDALIVSFESDASLPSKDSIIMTFSKFGSINEDETKLLQDSNCAQVVFISTSNAELAFKECIKQSPFSSNHVEYHMRYSSDVSRTLESGKTSSRSPRKRSPKKPVCLRPTGGDVSQVDLVRQNLVNLTSMLNQCNGEISAEEKSSLEGEIRSLLQKVGELGVKASS